MNKIWNIKKYNEDKVFDLIKTLKINELIAKLLNIRGIQSPDEAKKFLSPDLSHDLYSPFLFKDMEKAVIRIREAIDNKEKIGIFGDRDVDGISSTSIVYDTLKRLKADVTAKVPSGDDGYGISVNSIEQFNKENVKLIITVDNGITAFEAVDKAKEFNIDVIITDHHTPAEKIPEGFAVINPKSDELYPFKDLCGAGVAFKLVTALYYSYSKYFGQEFVVFDLETTGFKSDDEIIEIGAIKLKNFIEIDRFHKYVRPHKPISDEIQAITGITEEKLVDEKPISFIIESFYNFIKDSILVGHNINGFDMNFIKRDIQNYLKIKLKNNTIDTLQLSRDYIPHRSHTLENVASYFGIKIDGNYHSAIYDATVTAEIFKKFYKTPKKIKKVLQHYSQYAALGTLADVVPLTDENRLIVKAGIEQLKKTTILGLELLFKNLSINVKDIDSHKLAWKIIPVLNAAGRMGLASEALKLFTSANKKELTEIIFRLLELNQQRKERQDINFEKVMEILEDKVDIENDKIFIIDIEDMEHGVTGVIANRIKDIYYRPVAIMIVKDGEGVGTARSIPQFPLYENFDQLKDIFERFGGHKYAVGFSLKEEKIPEFKTLLKNIAEDKLKDEDLQPVLDIDTEIYPKDISMKLVQNIINLFEPFGETNNEPLFLIKGIQINGVKLVGATKKHLQIKISNGKIDFNAMWWSQAEEKDNIIIGENYDIVGRFEINDWRDRKYLSLIVEDMKIAK